MGDFSERAAPAASADSSKLAMPTGVEYERIPQSVRAHSLVDTAIGTLARGVLSDTERAFVQQALSCGDMHALNDFLAGRS